MGCNQNLCCLKSASGVLCGTLAACLSHPCGSLVAYVFRLRLISAHSAKGLLAIQASSLSADLPDLVGLCAQAFVDQVSGHEGAEVPHALNPDVSFDDPAFWRELKSALGVAADKHGLDLNLDSDSASSSDGFSDDDDGDGDESDYSDSAPDWNVDTNINDPAQSQHAEVSSSRQSNNPSALSSQQHSSVAHSNYGHSAIPYPADGEGDGASASSSEVLTATDSDDDEASFMHAYDDVLAQELSSSRVGSILHSSADKGDHQGAQARAETERGDDVKPVDLDTNLVRNLLQSYTAQQGLAGPAGNLAGLLGLNIPDNTETE